jgi:phosphatidate cytidylyltransferase
VTSTKLLKTFKIEIEDMAVFNMKQRIITGLIGAAFIALVIIGGTTLLTLGVLIIALIGVCEFYAAARLTSQKFLCTLGCVGTVFICMGDLLNAANVNNVMFAVYIFVAVLFIVMLYNRKEITPIHIALTVLGLIYVPYFLTHIIWIRSMEIYGRYFVWLVFIGAFSTDTFAYFVGKAFGKHKLAPELSPKKTTEGAVGGIIGAGLMFLLYGWIMSAFFALELNMTRLFILGIICAFVGQIGDLVASAIKRHYNVKDFGNLLPGHGGVLDRFDSILFIAPIVYLYITRIGLM